MLTDRDKRFIYAKLKERLIMVHHNISCYSGKNSFKKELEEAEKELESLNRVITNLMKDMVI
jgi:hypothetical protein